MTTGGLLLALIALLLVGLGIARARSVSLGRRLREVGAEAPVDPATGMVAEHVARLRVGLEADKAARLGTPLHVAVLDVRGGDRDDADEHGGTLAIDLHPATVGVRAGDDRFVLVSTIADPTAGIAVDQSIWAIRRYVVAPGSDNSALLDLVGAQPSDGDAGGDE